MSIFPAAAERLLRKMERYGAAHDGVWSIPREEAKFLYSLVEISRPKNILEIGTSTGYSAIWFGLAAKKYGGRVFTLEINPVKIRLARDNFKKAGLEKKITIIEGDANRILKDWKGKSSGKIVTLPKTPDLVFLDGEKEEYLRHYRMIEKHISKNAIIVADNAGDLAENMKDYLEFVRGSDKFISSFVPIGNGVELTIRRSEEALRFWKRARNGSAPRPSQPPS